MNKRFLIWLTVYCLIVAVFLTSCGKPSNQPAESLKNTEQSAPDPVLPSVGGTMKIFASDIRLVFDSNGAQKYLFESSYVPDGCFSDDLVFSEVYAKSYDDMGKYFGYYDINNQKRTELGEIKNLQVSSGTPVIMHKDTCYTWWSDNGAGYGNINSHNYFIKMDGKSDTLKILRDEKGAYSPFVYMAKLNEDEFLMHYYQVVNEKTISTVERYDTKTEKSEVIIREEYEISEKSADSGGKAIETVCVYDGKIYALGREKTEENSISICLPLTATGRC